MGFADGADPSGRAAGVHDAAYGESRVRSDEKKLRGSGPLDCLECFIVCVRLSATY